ncbi:hypothetical protein HDU98_010764, partial [Podochytrium sp. JEL0797]
MRRQCGPNGDLVSAIHKTGLERSRMRLGDSTLDRSQRLNWQCGHNGDLCSKILKTRLGR